MLSGGSIKGDSRLLTDMPTFPHKIGLTDGQAGTRDPEDLVGQGVLYKFQSPDSAQWSRATIDLGGRGAFGELVTGKRK